MTEKNEFFWRRLHSIAGLWLSIFLIEHLLTNSQAALLIGEDGHGFIRAVNWIHGLPYLPVIEMGLLGLPILIHTIWGIKYAFTSETNSHKTDGTKPYLPYPRNKAYTWQRITAWLLIIGIAGHVIQMRFLEYPASVQRGNEKLYIVRVSTDPGLFTLAQRLGVSLYDKEQVLLEREEVGPKAPPPQKQKLRAFLLSLKDIFKKDRTMVSAKDAYTQLQIQRLKQERAWVEALEKRPLKQGQIAAVAPDFGTAELLLVRDTFKSPSMMLLYTLFVLAACFHGFNGAWTFLITWGVSLSERSQRLTKITTTVIMILLAFFGLAAVWLTYWINLRT